MFGSVSFKKMEISKNIWSNFEVDLRPLKFYLKNLRPLIFLSENLTPHKKHSGWVFPIDNVHPLTKNGDLFIHVLWMKPFTNLLEESDSLRFPKFWHAPFRTVFGVFRVPSISTQSNGMKILRLDKSKRWDRKKVLKSILNTSEMHSVWR